MNLPIEVKGIRLRGCRQDDAVALADIEYDEDVKRYLAVPGRPREGWLRDFDAKLYEIIVEDVASQEVAGRASISRWSYAPDKRELTIVIGKPFWGYKYRYGRKVAEILIKEAYSHPDCNAVIGIVHPQNVHSQALLDYFHFANKGLLEWPSFVWQKGALVYELTRERYEHGEG